VVVSGQAMMFGCFFVVFCRFVVCFVCHFDCPVGKLPARSYAPVHEIVVACRRTFTRIAENSSAGHICRCSEQKNAPHRLGGHFLRYSYVCA
jgi:hypothetical protein